MQFLIAELAKKEGIVMGNEAAEIMYSVHTSNSAADQLTIDAVTRNRTEANSNV